MTVNPPQIWLADGNTGMPVFGVVSIVVLLSVDLLNVKARNTLWWIRWMRWSEDRGKVMGVTGTSFQSRRAECSGLTADVVVGFNLRSFDGKLSQDMASGFRDVPLTETTASLLYCGLF